MSMQSELDTFRAAIEANERAAANRMVQAYGASFVRLMAQFRAFMQRIQDYKADNSNEPPPASWIYEESRFVSLLVQTQRELDDYAKYATSEIVAQQRAAIDTALGNSNVLIQEAISETGSAPKSDTATARTAFNQLHTQAVEKMVGQTGTGTPLAELLNNIAPTVTEDVKQILVHSIVNGDNPRETAAKLRETMGTGIDRSLTISRTETLRAYRNAAIENYQLNKDVLAGWQWNAAKAARTCIMCIAMDGKVFPLDVPFGSHPNCRCAASPVTKSYVETLGIKPDEIFEKNVPSKRETGEEWFNRQTPVVQRKMLGRGKYDLWASGEIKSIGDFVGYKVSPKWGVTRWARSIKAIKAGDYREPAVSDIPRTRMAVKRKKAA